ncbi:MAG TPA: helix-turn-helix transcriptional regulator [Solirubrobacterales bacterium]|nr:helix-turn-helix transcriptional regulator [Solirubrobacterales bacterium]
MNKDELLARSFAANLKRCRREAGLSQEELSIRASLHRTAIGQLERCERLPHFSTFVKLAGSLQIEPTELLRGIEWQPGGTRLGRYRVGGRAGH